MAANDATELLEVIRLRGAIPRNHPDWTAEVLLLQAWREIIANHLPLLVAARGEYLVKNTVTPLVASQRGYRLNGRAAAVRAVAYQQADGRTQELPEANPTELDEAEINVNRVARPERYAFREANLELYPLPNNASDSLRVRWHMRPSRIKQLTDASPYCVTISAIAPDTPTPGTTQITFSPSIPGPAFAQWDFVKKTSPFEVTAYDLTATFTNATQARFNSSDLPSDLEVGDFGCVAGYSPIPNVPVELHHAIALRTAATIISNTSPALSSELVGRALGEEGALLRGILAPRSKGNAKRIVSPRRW